MARRTPRAGENHLFAAIEAVHAAGLEPELWPQGLGEVARLFGGAACSLGSFDKASGRPREYHTFAMPTRFQSEYFDYWAARNPRAIHGRTLKPGEIAWDYAILDERAMDRDPFYSDLLARTDFRYFLSGTLVNSADTHAVLAVQYARARGLSHNTVYWHLRHIKEKTGCKRLPELIGKLNELRTRLR